MNSCPHWVTKMLKQTIVHQDRKVTMIKKIGKVRGRGSKFQWNAKPKYVVISREGLMKNFSDYQPALSFYLAEVLKQ